MRRWFCLFLLFSLALPALAAVQIQGRISSVSDGDTLWLRPDAGQNLGQIQLNKGRVKLRLEAIDAPESCQDWGPAATAALQAQVQNQSVTAQLLHRDNYGRWLARLYLPQAANLDVNAWLVAQGHAWDYQFASGKPGRYAALQTQAKAAQRGLWSLKKPMQPRQFRHQHGACSYAHTAKPNSVGAPASALKSPWQTLQQWLTQWQQNH